MHCTWSIGMDLHPACLVFINRIFSQSITKTIDLGVDKSHCWNIPQSIKYTSNSITTAKKSFQYQQQQKRLNTVARGRARGTWHELQLRHQQELLQRKISWPVQQYYGEIFTSEPYCINTDKPLYIHLWAIVQTHTWHCTNANWCKEAQATLLNWWPESSEALSQNVYLRRRWLQPGQTFNWWWWCIESKTCSSVNWRATCAW